MFWIITISRVLLILLGVGSVFLVTKLIKPPKEVLWLSLKLCWVAGLLNLVVDFFEQNLGFWHYTVDGLIFGLPLDLYVAVSFFIGSSLCLIYWWISSFHKKWQISFFIILPLYFLLQDCLVISITGGNIIIFDSPYWWVADFIALTTILLGTLLIFKSSLKRGIKSKTSSILLTVFVLFILPCMATEWYVNKITIDEFAPYKGMAYTGVSKALPSQVLNISSSTPLTSFNSDKKFLDFDQMTAYLSLFNVNPTLIKYNLYLENKTNAQLALVDENKNISSAILPSVLTCGSDQIYFGRGSVLIKNNLQLNIEGSSDRIYVAGIYNQCVSQSNVSFQNTLGKTLTLIAIQFGATSGVRILVKPEMFSVIIILVTFTVLWVGFVTLVIQGSATFYNLLRFWIK